MLTFWATLGAQILVGCSSLNADKRILQQAVQKGFGRRYSGRSVDAEYVLVGDRVAFEDLNDEGLRGLRTVGIDGAIDIPQAGQVFVAGMSALEIETTLTQKLSGYFKEIDIRVSIETGGGRMYYVLGEVSAPGPKPFLGDITLMEAVLAAGPKAYSANLSLVRLIRADPLDPMIATLDVAAVWLEGDSTDNWPIEEFDIIYVPPTFMQEIADFISGILAPFTSIFRQIFQLLFQLQGNRFGNQRLSGF